MSLRLKFAKDFIESLESEHGLLASYIGGSVARGLEDEYSDLEICMIWSTQPTPQRRIDFIKSSGAEFPFKIKNQLIPEKSILADNIIYKNNRVDIIHATEETLKHWLDLPNQRRALQNYEQEVISVLVNLIPLKNKDYLLNIKKKISPYSLKMQKLLIQGEISLLGPGTVIIHHKRKDYHLSYEFISKFQKRVFKVLCAINKVWFPGHKHLSKSLKSLKVSIPNIEIRFSKMFIVAPKEVDEMILEIISELLMIIKTQPINLDTKTLDNILNNRRQKWKHCTSSS